MEAKLAVTVMSVDKQVINGTAIAAGGLAAVGLAALVALAAMRALNSKAADSGYAPWTSFESDGSVLDNPLYEKGGVDGSSPIYSSKQYVEMGSVKDSQSWL